MAKASAISARSALLFGCGIAVIVINTLLTLNSISEHQARMRTRPAPLFAYSFLEDDVPERLPLINDRKQVLLSMEDSVHFTVDGALAGDEWLYTSTRFDAGNINLGPNARIFSVDLVHELHCLRRLRAALDAEAPLPPAELGHSEHCLSYLRQHILCAADSTLEYGDAFARNATAWRFGGVRACADSEAFYGTMLSHWNDWVSRDH
ncbi:hypothetical protein PsYK624_085100 [Phanerochaete sordida]|uniref:Oxidase ustYa n=1 Tax=Phanerochaete sordida TaxID=48140 RepID=A0A9P3GCP8_9APHY|nr:hypothetical protein PsYK624_085100 [Phanerochaete sordida]